MRTRSGCWTGAPEVNACSGGSPSLQTPSSSARRSSGWWDSRTRSPRLVVERRIQEEALVGEPERLAGLAKHSLAQGYQLLTFREGADGDSPFFESNWHEDLGVETAEFRPRFAESATTPGT